MKKIDMSKVKSITLKSAVGGYDVKVTPAPRRDGWATGFDESTAPTDIAAWSADNQQVDKFKTEPL